MIFSSPYPSIQIPEIPLTPFVLRHASQLAGKTALIDGPSGRTLTFGQLAANVQSTAAGLAARGHRKGDIIAIVAPNSIEFAVAFHAIASIGAIAAPINPGLTTDEIAYLFRETGARCVFTTPEIIGRAREAIPGSEISEIIVFGEAVDATPFAFLLACDESPPAVAIDVHDDVVAIFCSSGTTGLPKSVQLTHFNMVATTCQFAAMWDAGEDATLPGHLPFFHLFGIVVSVLLGPSQGARSVVLPRFDFEQFLQIAQDYRMTRAYLVPPMVLALAKHPLVANYDLSALATIVCAAAPLAVEVAQACSTRLDCRVSQAYGMTEIAPTHFAPEDVDVCKFGTVGPCSPNVECKIVDTITGAELDVDQQGEIWVRGPAMTKGYLNRPDATAQLIDADGWVHTGDIGSVDADGYLSVVDRIKELIKYKAYQVAPAELEAVLLSHPAVADAAVIPSPDETAGEVPKAFVVLQGDATAAELIAFVADRVAPYKKIRRLDFIDAIPKSPSGKILRRVLVERERAAVAV